MIEWTEARSGALVPKAEGKFVHSRIDPVREASKWIDANILDIENRKTIIVLGCGAGFHLREILKRTQSNVIAIDLMTEFLIKASDMCAEYGERIHLLEFSDFVLKQETVIRGALTGSYGVFCYEPAFLSFKDQYREIELFLKGWSTEGFEFVSNCKSLGATALKVSNDISIETMYERHESPLLRILDSEFDTLEISSESRHALMVLKELLK